MTYLWWLIWTCPLRLPPPPPRHFSPGRRIPSSSWRTDTSAGWWAAPRSPDGANVTLLSKSARDCERSTRDALSPQSVPSRRFLPLGGALCWRGGGRTGARTDSCSEGGAPPATRRRDGSFLKCFNQQEFNSTSLMVWGQREPREIGGLRSSSMHVSMNIMCVQHHTGSPTELLKDQVITTRTDQRQHSVLSLYNSVRTRTRCTGETRQRHHYCVSETVNSSSS